MTAYEDYALQLRAEIHDGEFEVARLKHLRDEDKKKKKAGLVVEKPVTQKDVNETIWHLEYLKRELDSLNNVIRAVANGIELPEVHEPDETRAVRERLRNAALLVEE